MNSQTNNNGIMSSAAPTRFMSIDMLKCIAAFLVVVIHFTDNSMPIDLAGWVSHFSIAESRIAVPLFFMITGFFYGNMKRRGRLKSQLKKLTIMALGSTILYILYNLALSYFSGSFNVHEAGIFGWQTLAYLLIFNLTPGAGHLWFFYSMIYALVIIAYFDKINQQRLLQKLSVAFFLILLASNFTSYSIFTRNYLFLGIPFILLGRSFSEGKLKELLPRLSVSMCVFPMLLCMLLICFEIVMYQSLLPEELPQRECFIFSAPEAICIFALTLKFKTNENNLIQRRMALIGCKYSAYIYIFQYMAGAMKGYPYLVMFPTSWLKLLVGNPVVFTLSLIISIVYLKFKSIVLKKSVA